ncbi:GerAB/ArcD/ProY family transporter [Candidatus Woesearchaeota archaeon]|nr:GerAB/ArcD/ProY family transporter [Candidatus Woesearchaeota archaeon]
MRKKRVFEAISTLVGCVIGAGILGIPYVISQAGFITGLINILGLGIIILLINLYLGEITLRTKGKHQLTGYAEKYTGRIGKYFMFVCMIIGIYGAIIAYTIGAGDALASMLGWDPLICSVIFFGVVSWLIYIGLGAIEKSEAFVIPIVIILVLLIFFMALPRINMINLSGFSFPKLLAPYGVVLFAYLGAVAIPEMREELGRYKKEMKRAVIIGSTIPIIIYILFAIAVVGVMGVSTQEIGALGLTAILGEKMAFIGALFALFTLTTSFLAIGLALKELFWYDYGLRKNTSWLLACFIPFLLFLVIKLGRVAGFTTILNITGIVSGALIGILVVLMAISAKKKGERKPEYSIYINKFIAVLLIVLFIIGAINLLV